MTGGELHLDSSTPSTLASLSMSGGSITGAADLTVTSDWTWAGGSFEGSGSTVIPSGVTVTLTTVSSCEGTISGGRTLVNNGHLVLADRAALCVLGAVLRNVGTLTIQGDGDTPGAMGRSGRHRWTRTLPRW